ncbi:hypothetical protein ACEQ8H_006026 [Pleosporales sp. CAS-2024a]
MVTNHGDQYPSLADNSTLALGPEDIAASQRSHELALDLRGRKHVYQQGNADGVYLMQNDTGTCCIVFQGPGKASADAFRNFIQARLPRHLISDEYGQMTCLSKIPNDQLPRLQAYLWLYNIDNIPPIQPAESLTNDPLVQHRYRPTWQDTSTSTHVPQLASYYTFIVGLLQKNHVFIHAKQPGRACEFPACLTRAKAGDFASLVVKLEPLIHWGTVTPATNVLLCRGRAPVFRRDGEKCQDALWTQVIKKLIPSEAPAYCLGCLDMLMNNRVLIMDHLNTLQSSSTKMRNAEHASVFGTSNPASVPDTISRHDTNDRSTSDTLAATYEDPGPTHGGASDILLLSAAPLNLDGAHAASRLEGTASQMNGASSEDENTRPDGEESNPAEGKRVHLAMTGSRMQEISFRGAPTTSIKDTASRSSGSSTPIATDYLSITTNTFTPINRVQPNATNQPNPNREHAASKKMTLKLRHKVLLTLQTPPPRRQFGRETDTNTVLRAPTTSPRTGKPAADVATTTEAETAACEALSASAKSAAPDVVVGDAASSPDPLSARSLLDHASTHKLPPPRARGGGVSGHAQIPSLTTQKEQSAASRSGTSALGSLGFFGYAVARPRVLVEAYENAGAYAHLRERREQDEQDEGDEGDEGEDAHGCHVHVDIQVS